MATVPEQQGLKSRFEQFNKLPNQKKISFLLAAAAVIALFIATWMWSQTPDYRILYANISDDKEGGAVISALQQMNVPYKFGSDGSTIMVPGNQVHEIRLHLASQGLPRGGLASFELLEKQKFGSSHFLEQVNYQRALEGELARSIQSISAVQSARVHLAISRPTVFAREKKQPSASVLINLYPGRLMGTDQVNAIVHLVSSSIPNLPVTNVTVVDQDGNLLSTKNDGKSKNGLDASQLEYVRAIEENYAKRIEKILIPLAGKDNIRAQVTADVDFSRVERAEEKYRPNSTETDPAAIRSQKNMESVTTGGTLEGGIPGALTNRPPEPAIAPIELDGEIGEVNAAQNEKKVDRRSESTVNYEVDKTVEHTHKATGVIKRLSAAVVVNYRTKQDEEGNITHEPLTAEEIEDVKNLVREAMGFNEKRGDTLAVTNNIFNNQNTSDDIAIWKDPDMLMLAKDIGKQLLIAAIMLFLLLKVLRPLLKSLEQSTTVASLPNNSDTKTQVTDQGNLPEQSMVQNQFPGQITNHNNFEQNLQKAKQLANDEPSIVANVVKEWVTTNGQ